MCDSQWILPIMLSVDMSEMTLNYWVIVERYPFLNGVVGDSILAVDSSLILTQNQIK
jgi:hypothetical protein